MSGRIGVALPFWLDRPDMEALDIALAAYRAGIDTLWVGARTVASHEPEEIEP